MWLSHFLRQVSGRCARRCRCARRKEKGIEDEDPERADSNQAGECRIRRSLEAVNELFPVANGQDADEPAHVFEFLRPEFVVEATRPGVRVHKNTALVLPHAGGDLLATVVSTLPVELQFQRQWQLGYSMAVDGVSLRTLYRKLADVGPCLLVVEDSQNCIFGAFASEGLKQQNRCNGANGSFLFRLPRTAGAWRTEIFDWTHLDKVPTRSGETGYKDGSAKYETLQTCQPQALPGANIRAAVFCDHSGIVIGIDGPGLFIDQDLLRGGSWPSFGFQSPCLTAVGPEFVIKNIEIWHWKAPKINDWRLDG